MDNTTEVQISTQLKEKLQLLATEYNTNIDTVIKMVLTENKELKNPEGYLTESKVSKSKNNRSKSYTYSTVIPKPIINKFGLDKGQKLYWDINQNQILITPEITPQTTPEEVSIEAGTEILNDMLFNGNQTYTGIVKDIWFILGTETTKETKVKEVLHSNQRQTQEYKEIITYLLDYPLPPENHEVIQEVYEEITK